MKICFIDFETSGLDISTCLPAEVGALMCNAGGGKPLEQVASFSNFLWDESYPKQPVNIVELTGITDGLLQEQGRPPKEVFPRLLSFIEDADLLVAHNAQFDRGVLEAALGRLHIAVPGKEWLCTRTNFDWPKHLTCFKLSHLAYEHDVPHERSKLHRAINDCELLAAIFKLYDFEQIISYSREPFIIVQGVVNGPWVDGGVQNRIAKSLGFYWERIGYDTISYPKKWVMRIKQNRLPHLLEKVEKSESPFTITEIKGVL